MARNMDAKMIFDEKLAAKQIKVREVAEQFMTKYFQENPDKLRDHVSIWLAYEWPWSLANLLKQHLSPEKLKEELGFDPADLR